MKTTWSWPQFRRELAYLFLRAHSAAALGRSFVRRHARAIGLLTGCGVMLGVACVLLASPHQHNHQRHVSPPQAPNTDVHRPPTSAPACAPAKPSVPVPVRRMVTVRPGDTLSAIALRTGVPFEQIAADNHLRHPRHLRPGRQLLITALPPGVLVIAPGMTLAGYARTLGTTVRRLRRLNPRITDPARIRAGGGLRIRELYSNAEALFEH